MATRTPTRRNNFFLRYAPLLLIVSLVWFALTLQHRPISFLYIGAWVVDGLLYSLVVIFGLANGTLCFGISFPSSFSLAAAILFRTCCYLVGYSDCFG